MSISLNNQIKKIPFSGTFREQHYKLVALMTLACFCNETRADGHCWPSIRAIMKHMLCSRSTVFKYLKILEEEGWIRREARNHRNGRQTSNDYFLNLEMIKNKATIVICHDDPVMTQDLITLNEMDEIFNREPVYNEEDNIPADVDNYPDTVRPADPSKENKNSNILNHILKGTFFVDKSPGDPKIRSQHIEAMKISLLNAGTPTPRRN